MNLIYYSKKVDIYFSLFIFSVVTCILPKLVLVGLSLLVIGCQIVADAVIWKKTSFFFFTSFSGPSCGWYDCRFCRQNNRSLDGEVNFTLNKQYRMGTAQKYSKYFTYLSFFIKNIYRFLILHVHSWNTVITLRQKHKLPLINHTSFQWPHA